MITMQMYNEWMQLTVIELNNRLMNGFMSRCVWVEGCNSYLPPIFSNAN